MEPENKITEEQKAELEHEVDKLIDSMGKLSDVISSVLVKELRKKTGLSQAKFAERYEIPKRTIENWESGVNQPPVYVLNMLRKIVLLDLKNPDNDKI